MKAYAVEDSLVIYRPAAGNRPEIVWLDCPRCGPQPPVIEGDDYHTWLAMPSGRSYRRGYCSLCKGEGHLRYVAWRASKRKHVKCDRRCLEGQNDCNCGCEGRCHGSGTCQCIQKEVMA